MLLLLSSTISAIILFTLAIVLVLEPWIHFSGKKFGFNRPLAIFIGVVVLFLGLASPFTLSCSSGSTSGYEFLHVSI